MPHIHEIDDLAGDLVDLHYFCNDWCHRAWCLESGTNYGGWNGCHELVSDTPVPCHQCGSPLNVVPDVGDEPASAPETLQDALDRAAAVLGPMIAADIRRIDGGGS